MKELRKRMLWSLVLVALIVLTIYAMVGNNKSFTFDGFVDYVKGASWQWIALAFVSMCGFFFFEALAIKTLAEAIGYKKSARQSIVYATSDVYFSAITPSASGGQPASAFFMMKDGISGAATTIILIVNLTLYTLSIIVVGVICFATRAEMFLGFSPVSQIMIVIGIAVQFFLLSVFILLVYKEKIITKVSWACLNVLHKFHLVKNVEKKKRKLIRTGIQYKECVAAMSGKGKYIVKAFIYNFLQRVSLMLVSVCVFIAVGGSTGKIFDAFVAQGYVVLGSNSVPIPGAVGAADYLFIDGFGNLIKDSVSIELLSRGISFYCCIVVCGLITLGVYTYRGVKGMKRKKKC